ncbi:MAG: hypothetical protein HY040_14875 [Planctomycetes bacterium]|nr:hypothetical protein [Planctomycetota bacterium]
MVQFSDWPAWAFMWALAAAVFAGCKWLTFVTCDRRGVAWTRQAAYLFSWPGLDAEGFLRGPCPRLPKPAEWGLAVLQTATGALLIWVVARQTSVELPLVRGWIGMIGIVLSLHFGCFLLLSCIWRSLGYEARPLMNWPILSNTLAEFWGRRWNTAFRDLTHRFLFRPLTKRCGPRWAVVGGFLMSGLVHDLVISVPARGGYGLPTLYFLLQGSGVLLESSRSARHSGLGRGFVGWLFTAVVVGGPAFLLFHPPFVERVIVPFLETIGAF